MKNITVGIIGTGFGKVIGLNFKAVSPEVNIYFFGRNQEKLEKTVKEVGANGSYADWRELCSDPKIDLVVIATPSGNHKEIFEYASKFSKHILIEKPAALSSSEVLEMHNAFTSTDKIAVVNHEGRFHPVITYIKDLIDSYKLGDILTIRIGAYLNWYSSPDYKENWNNDKNLGGGQIYSIGTHQIDLANYLLGNPLVKSGSVQTRSYQDQRFTKKSTSDSQFSAHYLTDKETSIQLFCDCYCFGYKDFTIEIVGSKGIVLYSDQKGLKVSFANSQPLEDVRWVDPLSEITLGNSILTKSMKYTAKALIDAVNNNETHEPRFCTLLEEKNNLELFEKYANLG